MTVRAFIALGSNLGNRAQFITDAVKLIHSSIGEVISTSNLYETAPVGYLDQPSFLNAVCEINTSLSSSSLLESLKKIENRFGRVTTFKNGPRTLDLDILAYSNHIVTDKDSLVIPHPRMHQRAFVLKPLNDIDPNLRLATMPNSTVQELLSKLNREDVKSIRRVIPILNTPGEIALLNLEQTSIAGIVNMTPDSFSDGGRYDGTDRALAHIESLLKDGADIIDIGGESTRPGAAAISTDEELSRVIPVIQAVRSKKFPCTISIDTRNSIVARESISVGANIINDVSGGTHDPMMLDVASSMNVPIILMHMRGTPQTMTSKVHTSYDDVVDEVSQELNNVCMRADAARIPRWHQIIDPGIGFAKDAHSNLILMKQASIDRMKHRIGHRSMMIGMSRKRYLADILQQGRQLITQPASLEQFVSMEDRDWATAGTCCALAEAKVEILRVHNVRGVKSAILGYQSVR
jgi:dihydropteroate synthase/2-amino-4-hydroxy-6-hydroxymethyldihydropteridine diphosphokinase